MNTQTLTGKLMILAVFAIAMAFLETAVVIYLRELYYPEGFDFPLKMMDSTLAFTEILREAATMVMLLAVGFLLGRSPIGILAVFLMAFGIWDIFYYVFLKWLIQWPTSFLTWDILFLIPVMWVGPVLGPVINSICMILIGWLILYYAHNNLPAELSRREWIVLIGGALLVLFSYTEEFTHYLLVNMPFRDMLKPANSEVVVRLSVQFIPERFRWGYYSAGVLLHGLAITLYILRMQKIRSRLLVSSP